MSLPQQLFLLMDPVPSGDGLSQRSKFAMLCATCGGRMLITPTGCLVCEDGHGKLLSPGDVGLPHTTAAQLRTAWPERVIEWCEERKAEEKKLLARRKRV